MKQNVTTTIIWLSFFGVLLVLFPHAAWAFANFEPHSAGEILGMKIPQLSHYIAAFAFESITAALVYKISKRIEETPKAKRVKRKNENTGDITMVSEPLTAFEKFSFRYVNSFGLSLSLVTALSIMGNLAHAVQFGGELRIFTDWGIPKELYSVAFGGILPIVSLLFASVLSNVTESEDAPNPELTALNETLRTVRLQLKESEQQRKVAEQTTERQRMDAEQLVKATEQRVTIAEERFGAMGDLVRHLFGEDKRQRILTARRQWASLPNSAIAVIAEASPAYVSEILNKVDA